jgi:small subunit ribosomal protein S20
MAITKGAKKAIRGDEKKAVFNLRRKRRVKSAIKKIEKFLKEDKIEDAEKALVEAYKALDKSAKMGTIKKNAASRKKSRLSAQIRKTKEAKKGSK